jgi:hypothetical protein
LIEKSFKILKVSHIKSNSFSISIILRNTELPIFLASSGSNSSPSSYSPSFLFDELVSSSTKIFCSSESHNSGGSDALASSVPSKLSIFHLYFAIGSEGYSFFSSFLSSLILTSGY